MLFNYLSFYFVGMEITKEIEKHEEAIRLLKRIVKFKERYALHISRYHSFKKEHMGVYKWHSQQADICKEKYITLEAKYIINYK